MFDGVATFPKRERPGTLALDRDERGLGRANHPYRWPLWAVGDFRWLRGDNREWLHTKPVCLVGVLKHRPTYIAVADDGTDACQSHIEARRFR